MKKDLAEVKAYTEAMADSNRARDAYVDKEQDKFFRRVNCQRVDIDSLKERMERSELRARALELENDSLSARLDSMVDKLCFCTRAEVTSQVVGSEISGEEISDAVLSRLIGPSPSSSTPMSLRTILRTLRLTLSRAFPSKPRRSVLPTFPLWSQLHLSMPHFLAVQAVRFLTSR